MRQLRITSQTQLKAKANSWATHFHATCEYDDMNLSKGWKSHEYFFIHDVLWCIGLMDITLKNDYDFTVWKFGGFRPLKVGIPGVHSRLPDSPAAFARCVSRALSRARFTSRRASAVRNGVFLWSSVVRPSTELPLPERTSPSRSLFTLSTQQSQQRSRSFKSRWCR